MEVVQSSEELEKQILEDARAKASRILAEAERECAGIRQEWERRTEEEIRRLEADKAGRIAAVRQELAATLPLDFMRARLSFVQEAVNQALDRYFAGLSPAQLSAIMAGLLRRIPPVLRGAAVVVSCSGVRPQDARRVVEENVPGVRVEAVKEVEPSADGRKDVGLTLETTDGRVRFRGTLGELSAQLLEGHRQELAEALLGKDV